MNFEAGEVFAILILAIFGTMLLRRHFFIQIYIGIAITWFPLQVLMSADVCWTSSSSVGATTLGGFWPALRFRSTVFYLYNSLSSFSISSSLNPLLLGQAISIFAFLLVLMNMFPIQSIF